MTADPTPLDADDAREMRDELKRDRLPDAGEEFTEAELEEEEADR